MKFIFSTALIALSTSAWAQSNNIEVKDPWVRATVAQQRATGAFMQLTAQADTKLLEAKSPLAGVVEIHEMAMDKDIMKMRQVQGLALPAGKAVQFKPGAYHLMLMDLKAQVKEGDVVPLTLVFEGKDGKRESVQIKVPVKPLSGMSGMGNKPVATEHKH